MRYVESINRALDGLCAEREDVYLIGEDLLDPYGGAFKAVKGLSTRHPGRVLTTPISEAGLTGVAIGMAMRGYRPIVEIMFGDFLMLCADQIVNHATKFSYMYNEQVQVPLHIRHRRGDLQIGGIAGMAENDDLVHAFGLQLFNFPRHCVRRIAEDHILAG